MLMITTCQFFVLDIFTSFPEASNGITLSGY